MSIDSAASDGRTGKALVVEDDDDVRTLLCTHLARRGWDVRSAASGEDGLELAAAHHPEIAIIDVVLPGMDGIAVVRALRAGEGTAGCRIVMTSMLERDDLEDLGADALLPKPFTRRDVTRVLDDLVLEARA